MGKARFNASKFDSLVHFIISECDDPKRLGAIRLNKILWFTDRFFYWETGQTVTGSSYVKRQFGPVPSHILASLNRLESAGKIIVREGEKYQSREYVSLVSPETDLFSDAELDIASTVLNEVCRYTAKNISNLTHDEVWEAAELGEEIPFEATLFDTSKNIPDDVRKWANSRIDAA